MICYRLKHIPTGLYYRPSSERDIQVGGKRQRVKSNLSKNGKIYPQKPSLKWIKYGFYNHVQLESDKLIDFLADGKVSFEYREKHKLYPYVETDWEIEEC
jgi:hypothetical protein